MYTTKKDKVQLTQEELIELQDLNDQYQNNHKSMSQERKERLWKLMNKPNS